MCADPTMTLSSCARENFGLRFQKYVLHIIPKRQEKGSCCLATSGVDAKTYHIRRDCWNPAQESTYLSGSRTLHITLRFASENDMWMSVSKWTAICATIRFLGIYASCRGRDLPPPTSASGP